MNNYFCVLPFFGYEYSADNFVINKETHCCLLPNNYNIDSIKNDMLKGKRSPFCKACWDLEDLDLISDRQIKNSALDFHWDRDINLIEEDAKKGNYKPIMIKNITSNTCNSTCVTCSSSSSSAWAALENKMGIVPDLPWSMTKKEIFQNLNFKEIVMLNFGGGEPLYEKLNFYILEKLIENNNTGCFISITTNGSVNINNQNKELIKKFKNINFNVSIDGVGPVFEYLRYPLKWDKLLENLEFFRSITDNVNVSNTTSNLNILYYYETAAWFEKQGLKYHYNPVTFPSHFSPSALPKLIKNKLLDRHNYAKEMEFFIGKPHTKKDDLDYEKMLEAIKKQDQVKGISIQDYLPEFCSMLDTLPQKYPRLG